MYFIFFLLLAMGDKHTWTNEQTKCLLLTCIEEVQTVGRKGLSLHKQSWHKLGTTIKEKYGVDLNQRQLKNAYDNLKAKYTGWLYLKNKTGNLYNPQTNTFNLTNEEWEDFKKVYIHTHIYMYFVYIVANSYITFVTLIAFRDIRKPLL